jgi:3-oxoadipate enol-lactonase/4-carboxymuconolactone decarboxylase
MDKGELYDAGMKVRREVLGDAYVDAAVARQTPFTEPFQDLLARFVWASVWAREGLSRRDRSLVTVAALVAMGRADELRIHLRGALNNGVTPDEIRELLLQCAAYCGAPAALTAFHIASDVLAQGGPASGGQ